MFSFNLTKSFAFFALILTFFSGCRFWQNAGNSNSPAAPPVSDELKSEIPFSTKEPEQFQAEIVVTTGETERKTFIARNGANRRYDFNFGAKNQLTNLQTDKSYLILPAEKIYAENEAAQSGGSDELADFLTREWLSEKREAVFEKLETAGNVTKYRVRLGDGAAAAEIYVYVDEKSHLPVKQEFYTAGEQRTLAFSFELKNLKLEADAQLFAVPADFKKVSTEEFQKRLRSGKD